MLLSQSPGCPAPPGCEPARRMQPACQNEQAGGGGGGGMRGGGVHLQGVPIPPQGSLVVHPRGHGLLDLLHMLRMQLLLGSCNCLLLLLLLLLDLLHMLLLLLLLFLELLSLLLVLLVLLMLLMLVCWVVGLCLLVALGSLLGKGEVEEGVLMTPEVGGGREDGLAVLHAVDSVRLLPGLEVRVRCTAQRGSVVTAVMPG